MRLTYTGEGFIAGVPNRDMEGEEAEKHWEKIFQYENPPFTLADDNEDDLSEEIAEGVFIPDDDEDDDWAGDMEEYE